MDLESIYFETLQRCTPQRLVKRVINERMPRNVVAIGKCAGALLDGVDEALDINAAFVALPAGYQPPLRSVRGLEVAVGGHPSYTADSFAAGQRLLEFVDAHDDILFLISGGGSACVDVPRPPFTSEDLIATNERLLASGIAIKSMNCVRKQLSAIKGGRLGQRVCGRAVTLVHSDVSTGALADVASGPTLPDSSTTADAVKILERVGGCDRIVTVLRQQFTAAAVPEGVVQRLARNDVLLIADNGTLTAAAADIARERGLEVAEWGGQIETEVEQAAEALVARARALPRGALLIAGGEPTVVVRGSGRGGRCSELAVRFAVRADLERLDGISALFGSSDGVDGNSGVAGMVIETGAVPVDHARALAALNDSDAFPFASEIGQPIIMAAAGNNLRDMYLLARR